VNPIKFAANTQPFTLDRYQRLLAGEMFFGVPDQVQVVSIFKSSLVLWGITHGRGSRAVVGTDPGSQKQTWIVKSGDKIGSEQIVAIDKDFILVSNPTGQGRIYMQN
jgi:hypothetical protein